MTTAIRTQALAKRYRSRPALRGIDLAVPSNVVFGYLGPNGAGKTTTIRILAGLLRPTSGRAEILGVDAIRDRERAQRLIGYLPGDFVAYPNLTGEQYLRYLGNLRGGIDRSVVAALSDRLALDLDARVGALSHGNRQKLGIVQAFMHEPAVLILDEPTSGLDPLAQRVFLDMVREARDAGRTVFLSSHVLSEVEAVADVIAMLRDGELIVVETVETLKSRAQRRIDLTFDCPPPAAQLRALASVRSVETVGQSLHVVVTGSTAEMFDEAARYGICQVTTHEPDLEEIFMTYYSTEVPGVAQRIH